MDIDEANIERVERVIFVDDEQDVLDSIIRDLGDWIAERGVEVVAVTSARDALECVADDYPRTGLVVSDLRMPGMSGADLFVAISERYPEIGLVMVTAYSDMEAITRAVASSMLGLIQKPWDVDRLVDEMDRSIDLVERGRALIRQTHEHALLERRADRFRSSFLHMRRPSDPSVEVTSLIRPSPQRLVTRDFFAVRRLSGGEYLAYVGESDLDGFSATLLTATLRIQLEEWRGTADPTEFLSVLVRRLDDHTLLEAGRSITISVVVVDRNGVRIACSGEPGACLVSDGDVHWPAACGPPIRTDEGTIPEATTVPVTAGDRIVLFSDGIAGGEDRPSVESAATVLEPIFLRAHASPEFEENVVRLITANRILRNASTVPLFRDDATLISIRLVGGRF